MLIKKFDYDKVRTLRELKKMTQVQLAEAVGLTRDTIYRIERGRKAKPPRKVILERLAEVLGVEVEDLFHFVDTEVPKSKIGNIDADKIYMPSLNPEQKKIVELLFTLSPQKKIATMAYIAGLLASSDPYAAQLASDIAASLERKHKT